MTATLQFGSSTRHPSIQAWTIGMAAAASLWLSLALPSSSAHAARSTYSVVNEGSESSNPKTKRKTRSQGMKIQPSRNSSEETPAQRDKRLYRECQGLPNAGACAGYTQGPRVRQR